MIIRFTCFLNTSTFFSWRKKRNKRTCAVKESLKFLSFRYSKITLPTLSGSNIFYYLTLHFQKFLYAILLRRKKHKIFYRQIIEADRKTFRRLNG